MNGPEHYREAERLLESLDLVTAAADRQKNMNAQVAGIALAQITAQAQVHATLAAAAATAYPAVKDYTGDEHGSVSRGWAGVA